MRRQNQIFGFKTYERSLAVLAFFMGFGVAALFKVPTYAAVGPNLAASGGLLAPPNSIQQNSVDMMLGQGSDFIGPLNHVLSFPTLTPAHWPTTFALAIPTFNRASLQTPLISDEFRKWADANFSAPAPELPAPYGPSEKLSGLLAGTIR